MAIRQHAWNRAALRTIRALAGGACAAAAIVLAGCAAPRAEPAASSAPSSSPAYDTTAARPIHARDALEKMALKRGPDFTLIDRLMDERTRVPTFERSVLPPFAADTHIAERVPLLPDRDPFPIAEPLAKKDAGIYVALGRSTYRGREPEEVLAAVEPFMDLEQREVNVRPEIVLFERAEEAYFGLLDGKRQMAIAHVFEYLLARSWFQANEGNGTILLGVALPAHPRTTDADQDFPGVAGASVELIVARDAAIRTPAELRGKRLALAAFAPHAPGAFLTGMLRELNQPADQPFFASVTLRRFGKDALLDVLKGRADVACVDRGTVAAAQRFWGADARLRTLRVSPRYHFDVLFTSVNNVATHRTEIELTQRQLATLGKNPPGQEVLFFFDQLGWRNPEAGDLQAAEAAFADFLAFFESTPTELKPLLDAAATIDWRTYDRFGDE